MSSAFKLALFSLAVFVLCWYLAACTSPGLFTMLDAWCAAHPDAPAYHCQPVVPPHRTQGLDPQGHLPASQNPHGELCPGQYTYRLSDGTPLYCWGKKA